VRLFIASILLLVLGQLGSIPATIAIGQEANVPAAKVLVADVADWLPDGTQGFARVVDFPRMLERWKKTQLGKLADDDRLQDFWKEQQKTIDNRFAEAGWQLNISMDDISKVASGQSAIAWISKPDVAEKPYAVALAVDVRGNEAALNNLLQRIDTELKGRQATSQKSVHAGVDVTQYTLPRGAGQLIVHESFYAVVDGFLFATDDLSTLKEIVDAKKSGRANALAKSKLFTQSLSHVPSKLVESDVEYFVQPIGLAKLLRAIAAKPVKLSSDVLKVLDNQGFSKLSAVAGRFRFSDQTFDVYHEAFVLAEKPLPVSVQVLDFPNLANGKTPSWVTPKAASYMSLAWNAKEAFWKVKDLVDDIAGQTGTFDSVIQGIQEDANGPQVDIKNDVLPFVTPEIFSVTETVEPITPDSRHSLIAIRINDANGKLARALARAMTNEPEASMEDFQDIRIWKVTRSEDSDEALNVDSDFGFGSGKKGSKASKPKEEEEPLLSNWAITIFSKGGEQYLMFSSHAEMIKEAITLGKIDQLNSQLDAEPDVVRVIGALKKLSNDQPGCLWEISRPDRAFRMQYELFRQDKLPQSRSMLATILDRILRPKDELKDTAQRVKGNKLPAFDDIKSFFQPGGSRIITQPDGWSYQGFILAK
jgi:hypothetical protein